MELSGKVALITGGGGGIGAGIGEAFVEKGAKVVLTDINRDYAQAEAARIGGGALALEHDVTSLDSWAAVRDAACTTFGQIDILCNNAGVAQAFRPLIEVEPDEFDRLMAINVRGVYNGIRTCVPAMVERGAGHVVNTSSMNGLLAFGSFATYSATKFAVAGMSEALQQELAPAGVGVSILYPGLTRSRMSEDQAHPGMDEKMLEVLRNRMMEPVWLGRAVARAVEDNSLHIITHPDHRDALEARVKGIFEAHGEPAQPGYQAGSFSGE